MFALSACAADNPSVPEVISGPIVDRVSFPAPRSRVKQQPNRSTAVNGMPGEPSQETTTDTLNDAELHQYDKIIWDSNYLTGLLEQRKADARQHTKADHP